MVADSVDQLSGIIRSMHLILRTRRRAFSTFTYDWVLLVGIGFVDIPYLYVSRSEGSGHLPCRVHYFTSGLPLFRVCVCVLLNVFILFTDTSAYIPP